MESNEWRGMRGGFSPNIELNWIELKPFIQLFWSQTNLKLISTRYNWEFIGVKDKLFSTLCTYCSSWLTGVRLCVFHTLLLLLFCSSTCHSISYEWFRLWIARERESAVSPLNSLNTLDNFDSDNKKTKRKIQIQ